MGCYFGLSLMQAGGGNCIFNLYSEAGKKQLRSIIGLYMFTFYWYWYPLVHFIGLSHEPTMLVGCTAELKVPKGFTFISKAPKSRFDYYKTPVVKEEKDEKKVVILSRTLKAKARIEKR